MSDYRDGYITKMQSNNCILTKKSNFNIGKYQSDNYHYLLREHSELKIKFRKLYQYKCVYCGITNDVISNEMLELDHYYPYTKRKDYNGNINELANIVLSCHSCNRSKSSFLTEHSDKTIFHPDMVDLGVYFERKKDYTVCIRNDYKTNTHVCAFYEQLKMKNYHRRLDHLIMMMSEFCKNCTDITLKNKLQDIKEELRKKRTEII